MNRADHKVKRIRIYHLPAFFSEMRLQAELNTDSYIQSVFILFFY